MSNATRNSKSLQTGLKGPSEKYAGAGSAQQEDGHAGGVPSNADLKDTTDPHPGSVSDGRSPTADEGNGKTTGATTMPMRDR